MRRRVRVKDYGRIERADDPRLWPVPSTKGKQCLLHWAAASSLAAMARGCPYPLLVVSGWRPRRWRSWAHYVKALVRRYTTRDQKAKLSQKALQAAGLRNGRRWLAFDSPHETGLAPDFGSGGLWPARKTAKQQRQTEVYKWLVENAGRFGFANYGAEPWHWEHVGTTPAQWKLEGPEAQG